MTAHTRIGGAWKEVDTISARVGGAWKTVEQGWTRVGGAWKEFYASAKGYSLISEQILTANATSVTFSNIPQTYGKLVLTVNARDDQSASTFNDLYVRINGSSSAIYGQRTWELDGGIGYTAYTYSYIGFLNGCAGGGQSSNYFGSVAIEFENYKNTTQHKFWKGWNETNYAYSAGDGDPALTGGAWRSTAAITSLLISSLVGHNYIAGSKFSLYGIEE